jgi:hypothetical protein
VIEVRRDWDSKRADEGVPGAPPPDGADQGRGDAGGGESDEETPPDTPTHKRDPAD